MMTHLRPIFGIVISSHGYMSLIEDHIACLQLSYSERAGLVVSCDTAVGRFIAGCTYCGTCLLALRNQLEVEKIHLNTLTVQGVNSIV